MQLSNVFARVAVASFLSLATLTPSSAVAAESLNHPSKALSVATDHGRLAASKQISVTVHLTKTNEEGFLKAVDALYAKGSPTYHKWMTDEDLKQYEPSADKVYAVRKELESHGLTILSVDSHGFRVRARGSVGAVESAFGTELHEFEAQGKVFRSNVTDAKLTGVAGNYVKVVSGLESHTVRPMVKRAINFKTGQPWPNVKLAAVKEATLGSLITDQSITSATDFTFTTPGATLPVGNYRADVYDVDSTIPVSFTPEQLHLAYGLPAIGTPGYDGKGQTIVLLEAYGYPTALADANAYFSISGLPALTSSTFSVVYPDGPPVLPTAGIDLGWDVEIAIDVQTAHTIAPAAKIVVVAAAGQDDDDFQSAIAYIIANKPGYAISDSWGEDIEGFAGPAEVGAYEALFAEAAAKGISFQFSSGDSGDDGFTGGLGGVSVPGDSLYITSVGGTSIINAGTGFRLTGWGNAVVLINDDGVLDPPEQFGFIGGAGGGESIYLPKPTWQAALPGSGRQTPDVSALADPYTGVNIVITSQGTQYLESGWGGTSVASPIVTAFWAMAEQKAGGPLGQAAPLISTLTSASITDVVPFTPAVGVTGYITDSSGTTVYTPADLFSGLIGTNTGYTTAIWPLDGGEVDYAFAFGLDSTLTVTTGWDNVTGYGSPRGEAFINAIAAEK